MSRPFRFKQFTIHQEKNAHKVGTDSMILGAWIPGEYSRILDIGTGTGVLALMLAQRNPTASITAIEPNTDNHAEAYSNIRQSPFNDRMMTVPTRLQDFASMDQYDLIVSNPPYFENDYKSHDVNRNAARHTDDLRIDEVYEYAAPLLQETGKLALVFPSNLLEKHLHSAQIEGLYPEKILRQISPNGNAKRYFILFSKTYTRSVETEDLKVKNSQNQYSKAYIQLTRDFHNKELN